MPVSFICECMCECCCYYAHHFDSLAWEPSSQTCEMNTRHWFEVRFELSRSTRSVIIDYKFDLIESFWFHLTPLFARSLIIVDVFVVRVSLRALCLGSNDDSRKHPNKLLCYSLHSQTDIPTPSFTSTQTINFSPKCIKFVHRKLFGNLKDTILPNWQWEGENHRLWRWFYFMCQWKTVTSNCDHLFCTNMEMYAKRCEEAENKIRTFRKNILTSSFQQLWFSFLFNSSCVRCVFFSLSFSFWLKSNFLYQFFAVILSLSFYIVGFSVSYFYQSRESCSDYLLNDIMTSNLVINQILIVLFVAVNIRQIRFSILFHVLERDTEAKTGKTWTETKMVCCRFQEPTKL